jgi:N-acetyl-gamma-glutamylphosphate reductase
MAANALSNSVFGLPEIDRDAIQVAKRIDPD